MNLFLRFSLLVVFLSLVACGGDSDAPDGTVEISVQEDIQVKINESAKELTKFANPGKVSSKTVNGEKVECYTVASGKATGSYDVSGDNLIIETQSLTRVSGTSGQLWGEWVAKDEVQNGVTIRGYVVFYEDRKEVMTIKARCFVPEGFKP